MNVKVPLVTHSAMERLKLPTPADTASCHSAHCPRVPSTRHLSASPAGALYVDCVRHTDRPLMANEMVSLFSPPPCHLAFLF